MNTYFIYHSRKGFTLAEVLITIGIIGILAAMTMPSLITKHREKRTVTQLKKTYSTVQQAYIQAINKYGEPDSWGVTDTKNYVDEDGKTQTDKSGSYLILRYLAENLNTINSTIPTFYRYSLKNENKLKQNFNKDSYITLNDGTAIVIGNTEFSKYGFCDLAVLLNNCQQKGSCVLGKDMFFFQIFQNPAKIIPVGAETSQYPPDKFSQMCNKKVSNIDSGKGCTAWVIYNENMDYLHCDDLDWNNKTKCK